MFIKKKNLIRVALPRETQELGRVDLRDGPNDEFLKHPELLPKDQRERIAKANREWEELVRQRAARAAAAENAAGDPTRTPRRPRRSRRCVRRTRGSEAPL